MDITKPYKRLQRRWRLIYAFSFGLALVSCVLDLLVRKAFLGFENGTLWILLLFLIPIIVQWIGVDILDSRLMSAQVRYRDSQDTHLEQGIGTAIKGFYNESNIEPSKLQERINDEIQKVKGECKKDYEALTVFSEFYLKTMALCLLSYLSLWLIYSSLNYGYNWERYSWNNQNISMIILYLASFLSVVAIVAILFLLRYVMIMTHAIIAGALATREADRKAQDVNREEWLRHDSLKRGASQAPFLALLFFLAVFLGVSYLFGFALAFHDKTQPQGKPGLVMKNLITPEPTALPPPSPSPPASVAKFQFGSGTAILATDGMLTPTERENAETLKNIIEEIDKKTEKDNPIRITLAGRADLQQIKVESRAYQSNYELAEARAQYIKRMLMTKLSSRPTGSPNILRNIEWLSLSEPNEGLNNQSRAHSSSKSAKLTGSPDENQEDRVVRVLIEQNFEAPASLNVRQSRASNPNPLSLMDYVYFANYTITTTGYGDIVPNTTYTKFICSFANICEVFFLVVLFNSLLSLRGSKPEHEMPHTVEAMSPKIDALHETIRSVTLVGGTEGEREHRVKP